jgi:hypothetical protein
LTNQIKESIKPANQIQGSIKPTNQIRGSIQSTNQVRGSVKPTNQIKELIKPTNQIRGSIKSTNQVRGSIKPTNQIKGSIKPTNQVRGSIKPTNQIKGSIKLANQVRGSIYLICDQSSAHNKVDMIQALRAAKYKSVKQILHMPTASATYLSPLDNPLWHSFKEAIRSRHPLSTTNIPLLLSETFYSLFKQEIKNAYRKCGLVYGTDEYYDRP